MSDVGERELLAIIFTDAVDSTARTASDEDYSLRILLADLDYMRNEAAVRGGTVLKNTGDGLLISFKSAVDAVECALSIQKGFANRAENAAFTHKIGVHIGDVIKKDGDIYGSGVNTASRLVAQCPAGGICMSSTLYELVKQKSQIGNLKVENFQVTNIEPPIKAYRVQSFTESKNAITSSAQLQQNKRKIIIKKQSLYTLGISAIIVLTGIVYLIEFFINKSWQKESLTSFANSKWNDYYQIALIETKEDQTSIIKAIGKIKHLTRTLQPTDYAKCYADWSVVVAKYGVQKCGWVNGQQTNQTSTSEPGSDTGRGACDWDGHYNSARGGLPIEWIDAARQRLQWLKIGMSAKDYAEMYADSSLILDRYIGSTSLLKKNFKNHGYQFIATPKIWNDAKKNAEEKGGYLVCISSADENDFVVDLIKNATNQEVPKTWIGLNDDIAEGDWRWINGEPAEFTCWFQGEPNNSGSGENKVVIVKNENEIKWNDVSGDARCSYVIEYNFNIEPDKTK